FAQIAVQVARYLDVNTIAFGSETPDITRLKNVANEIINLEHSSTFNQKVKEGSNYAKIINDLVSDNTLLKMPNNILAISYPLSLVFLQVIICTNSCSSCSLSRC
ncbi:nucleotidyltransferase family protein, partial [Streptococcus pneumoniae]|uniref:nucleotidyltransferase family protein n=1 Tax=Streptococcus pneumoniae TaxID=1313 RepID=UPI001CB789AF